jgi:hypothetical protein
LNRGF